MSGIQFPPGWRIETLEQAHRRREFNSGQTLVDAWLQSSAFQSQSKHLTVTKVLLDEQERIVGFYSLATAQVDFSDLPPAITKKLPRRQLPVAVLAWLGIDQHFQAQGYGQRLLATALRDCHHASETFPFIAIILDCVDETAKRFYGRYDFQELPGYPMRLYLPADSLKAMIAP